jgi:hypothetical protein
MRFYLSLFLVFFLLLKSEAQQEKKYQKDKIDSETLGICGSGCSEGTIDESDSGVGLAFLKKDFLKAKRGPLLGKIQTDFEERKNVKANNAKDQVLLLNGELIQKQKLQTILIAMISALSLFLAGILYKFYWHKLQINIKLDQKVKAPTEELRHNSSNLMSFE